MELTEQIVLVKEQLKSVLRPARYQGYVWKARRSGPGFGG